MKNTNKRYKRKSREGKSFMVTIPSEKMFIAVNNTIAKKHRINLKDALQALTIAYFFNSEERALIDEVLASRVAAKQRQEQQQHQAALIQQEEEYIALGGDY